MSQHGSQSFEDVVGMTLERYSNLPGSREVRAMIARRAVARWLESGRSYRFGETIPVDPYDDPHTYPDSVRDEADGMRWCLHLVRCALKGNNMEPFGELPEEVADIIERILAQAKPAAPESEHAGLLREARDELVRAYGMKTKLVDRIDAALAAKEGSDGK